MWSHIFRTTFWRNIMLSISLLQPNWEYFQLLAIRWFHLNYFLMKLENGQHFWYVFIGNVVTCISYDTNWPLWDKKNPIMFWYTLKKKICTFAAEKWRFSAAQLANVLFTVTVNYVFMYYKWKHHSVYHVYIHGDWEKRPGERLREKKHTHNRLISMLSDSECVLW